MVNLTELLLPILLSAVVVFIASSIVHMALPHHRNDYRKLPNEDRLLEFMRSEGVVPGNYNFPHAASPKEMGSAEMIEKFKKGPVGVMNVVPNGPPAMGKYLLIWFIFCVVVSVFVAYVAAIDLGPGVEYLTVFRITGTVAFLSYSGAHTTDSIWKGQHWSTTFKLILDGLVYGLATGGVFGWLWPR